MTENKFYTDFDCEELDPRDPDYRSVFQRGRDRLIHNAAFRRLQAKTQVFLSGEYDFYRTRLTHSIEVSQIAGSITRFLNSSSSQLSENHFIDIALVEACALSHDIGHPPFGHAGEGMLHQLMMPWGGFEGNAQTLRLITEIIFTSGRSRRGMNPTRAFMDGVLKYKTLFSQWDNPSKHFLYDDQKKYLDFVFDGRPFPAQFTPGRELNKLRSLECQIMDWADDTAYSLNDLVDSANAGFVTIVQVSRWAEDQSQLSNEDTNTIDKLIEAMHGGNLERVMNRKIGSFVEACQLVERDNFMSDVTNRYRFGVELDQQFVREQQLYAQLAVDLVFRSPQVCQLEHKGNHMLTRLFEALEDNYLKGNKPRLSLLSRDFEEEMANTEDLNIRARILCDYLAGMTDGFATRIYKRMFDPDFGSIVDLV